MGHSDGNKYRLAGSGAAVRGRGPRSVAVLWPPAFGAGGGEA